MSLVNTINFLPEVFRTSPNQAFLNATMDQLTADSVNTPLNGYIGRTFSPTYKSGDNYVPEINSFRKNYQLEPTVVVKNSDGSVKFKSTYIDLLHNIGSSGGVSNNAQRLFGSESYSYDGKFDYDKFVNYYKYYWLPNGPSAINVYADQVPYTADYTVTRNIANGGYTFSGQGQQPNTPITLARGGTYEFKINQPGFQFWIQNAPGVSGTATGLPTVSTRQIFGVTNNGTDSGTIRFNVPLATAQDFYSGMTIAGPTNGVDAATQEFGYTAIQNKLLSSFLAEYPTGIDGLNNQLAGKNIVFLNTGTNDVDDSFWTTPAVPAGLSSIDISDIRPGYVIPTDTRRNVWTIRLIPVDANNSDYLIQLHPTYTINPSQKIFVRAGLTFASLQFWLNNNYLYTAVPAITAAADYLYYQDSSNPGFFGEIKIVDNVGTPINVTTDILGKKGYTSPNGVIFTNGIKIAFDSTALPSTYANSEYYVDGVGTSISLVPVDQLVVPESFGTQIDVNPDYVTINRSSQDRNAWSRYNRWFHTDALAATATYNQTAIDYGPNIPARRPIIEFNPNLQLFNYGTTALDNVNIVIFSNPVANIVSGGTYTILSVGTTNFVSLGAATNTVGTTFVATRNGSSGDGTGTTTTDAFNQVEGQATATVDGVAVANGQLIVFANDYDINVKNKIWKVVIQVINAVNFITLVNTGTSVTAGTNILALDGGNAGNSYHFDGTNWHTSQEKTVINQAPLFDLVDINGYSFGDTTVYPNSTFAGTKNFGYPVVTSGTNDTILGFPLQYQNFDNIGDIVYKNYYDSDTFSYTENNSTVTVNCNSGYFAVNSGTSVTKENNWVANVEPTEQYQVFTKFFDGTTLTIPESPSIYPVNNTVAAGDYAFIQVDVLPNTTETSIPYVKVSLNNTILTAGTDYNLITFGVYYVVQLMTLPTVGDKIDVQIYSDSVSTLGYYEVPKNLDQNPLNEAFPTITLGQLRTHYTKLIENYSGTTPTQDTYLKSQGGTITTHSSPVIYASTFLNDPTVNFINGITLARKEYNRFKNKFLMLCASLSTLDYSNPVSGVDTILQSINLVKNNSFPWYYSDMVPQGGSYSTITYNILNANQTQYEINSLFDNTVLSNRAVLVYLNNVQLTVNIDYTFSQVTPSINITKALTVGDVLTIRDYSNTDGNYIPETPSKLGLYPTFVPSIYVDNTYLKPTTVILGHDGSKTPAFGDFRDQYLLELERRIYNNIKTDYSTNEIDRYDIIPGRFRKTDYSLSEFTQLLTQNFLQWSGANRVDYSTNSWYNANNPWAWNYAYSPDTIDGSKLQGYWRAVYQYFYDTDTPNISPWEMLGFGSAPSWWITRYGPAPYTKGNSTLWDDLEAGYIWNNGSPYNDKRFARPGLSKIIPVDNYGNLLDPSAIPLSTQTLNGYSSADFAVGHQGPVETAWRNSSDFPYALQQAFALAKPAQYFSTQIDTSLLYKNPITEQFSTVNNNKINPMVLNVNGDSTSGTTKRTSGYINWIGDSIKNLGIDPVSVLNNYFSNFFVQLSYKVGGFTDKKILTVSAEQTTPSSTNAGVIIPDENYKIYLSKSVPISTATYSAVIVEKTLSGYSVSGYDLGNPFFTIIPSSINNNNTLLTSNGVSAPIYRDSSNTMSSVAYGTEFANVQQVVDFLVSYQRYLSLQGFVFTEYNTDLQRQQDFVLSAEEFLYWSQQGWGSGTIIVLNPITTSLELVSSYTVVDEITNDVNGSRLADQNFNPIRTHVVSVLRDSVFLAEYNNPWNVFKLTVVDGTSVCFAKFNLVQYEHTLLFDNVDDFGDIIYVPSQGTRQFRLKLSGHKTGAWTGMLSAPGYVYSNPTILQFKTDYDYKMGDIVEFGSNYYTAPMDIPASDKFNITQWTPILASDIQTGLLPSLGYNAQKFENYYDVDVPPQEEDLQLYSAGLIGFRERPYLTDLGITIPNQTKFYQGYIKQKGSLNSILALTKADFENVQSSITTYEEWAFLAGKYGDLNQIQFNEFILDQSVFTTNPVAFTYSPTYATGNILVDLSSANIYNSSNLSSSITSIYDNRTDNKYITDLPTAGFVNFNDINSTLFNIADATPADVLNIGVGHKLWVAKNSSDNWDVLRVTETNLVATTLAYTLNSYAQLIFNGAHAFEAGDSLVLTNFNTTYGNYNGVYSVISVPNSVSVIINISPAAGNNLLYLVQNSPVTATGTVYSLDSLITNSFANVTALKPLNGWRDNDRLWVNNATKNGWGVYTYSRPWLANAVTHLTANTAVSNSFFGNVVKINHHNDTIYVGNPIRGNVQSFANVNGTYTASTTLSNANPTFGYGIASKGNITVVSAPQVGNVHVYYNNSHVQMIHSPNASGQFGYSISMSDDQHWLYVSEPVSDYIQAYWTANVDSTVNYTSVASIHCGVNNFIQTVVTNGNGNILIAGSPVSSSPSQSINGNVYVYKQSGSGLTATYTLSQTITSQYQNKNAGFGYSIAVDYTGGNVFIGAPGSTQSGVLAGQIERYVLNSGTYSFKEYIAHPFGNVSASNFGATVAVNGPGNLVVVSATGAKGHEETTFDNNLLLIDEGSTIFVDAVYHSGAAYIYEPIIDQTISNNLGNFTFTQELESQVITGDQFGYAVDVSYGTIAVTSPGANHNSGNVEIFHNPNQLPVWTLTRSETPQVDIDTVNRTFIYNKTNNNILAALDYIDPKKGKLLNAIDKDIDFKLENDPAVYNAGSSATNTDIHWGPTQVGRIWWDLSSVRYVEYEQDELIYRLTNWGSTFPGSKINVYQWVESTVLPSQYVNNGGTGTPLHPKDTEYCTYGYVDQVGNVHLTYYFWVTNLDTVYPGKTNSVISIIAGIENPQSQGIPYSTVLRDDTVALYNVNNLLTGQNSVVHLEKRTVDSGLIHSEYALVQEGNPASQIPNVLLSKLIDSLSGEDAAGNLVPDPALTPAQAYGISIKPRQGMFINNQLALTNYIQLVNKVLASYPIAERKVLTLMNSSEPIPAANSGVYSIVVATYEELGYVNTSGLPNGYAVLVSSDSNNNGKWAVYTWSGTAWSTTSANVQSYMTPLYWNYVNWYDSSYDPTRTVNVTVANQLDFGKLTLEANTYVKVLNNSSGNFVVYYIDSKLNQNLVGIENGTIQISTATIPALELRQILLAVQTQLLINDLAGDFNTIFFSMIKYALTEQKNLDWVFKTSFLSATQYIRKLEQFTAYIPDNQNYYLDYIEEVKPYRTILREFVVDYIGNDQYGSDITDFDLPPYWDKDLQVYRSPSGEQTYDANLLSTSGSVYSQWYQNHTYSVTSITVDEPGTGFILPPQIIITGGGGSGATAVATLNGSGGVAAIEVVNPGDGYTTTPTVIINGTGTGTVAHALLQNVYEGNNVGHNLVRSISTTIKFDRVNYAETVNFVFWANITSANIGNTISANSVIVLNNDLYLLNSPYTIDSGLDFPLSSTTQINSEYFNNANDRIVAYNGYIDLSAVQKGITYPGVIIDGNTFTGNTYDATISSYYPITQANIVGGNPVYNANGLSPDSLITNANSSIIIDGGAYYDLYNSHNPEELVPGILYDSLNMKVFAPTTGNISFRVFKDMSNAEYYTRIAANGVTTLASNLNITDSNIHVTSTSVLPDPNPENSIPGIVFIDGEKITYYTIDRTHNLLGQIRRAVDGTGAPLVHPAGTLVADSSLQQAIPATTFTYANIGASSVTYNVTGNVSYVINLSSTVTANIGDYINQIFSANSLVSANLRVLGNVVNSKKVPVIVTQGAITSIVGNVLTHNSSSITGNITSSAVLGMVSSVGNVTVAANTVLAKANDWYSTGSGTATNGLGLAESTTLEAQFLLATPGYTP